MDILSRAHIIKYHRDCIRKFGIDSDEAIGWKSKENQQRRFGVFTGTLELDYHSVLDVGCGTGDLLLFFDERNIRCRYTGIDQVKEFIEEADRRFAGRRHTAFLIGDFWTGNVGYFDYILASGALSYRNTDPGFIYNMIFRLYSLCDKAFAFNLLENVELKDGGLVAYDKVRICEYCKKICANVSLFDQYLEGDYTIVLRKQ
jgi:SAM-dependent methyltransferase